MCNNEKANQIQKAVIGICELFKGKLSVSFYKDIIFWFLFLKYLNVIWETRYNIAHNEFRSNFSKIEQFMLSSVVVLPAKCSFDDLYSNRAEVNNSLRISTVIKEIETLNPEIFPDGFSKCSPFSVGWPTVDDVQKDRILREMLEVFNSDCFDFPHDDEESITRTVHAVFLFLFDFFSSAFEQKKDEFYTPADVSSLLRQLLQPQKGESIYDPFCGTGSLLLSFNESVALSKSEKRKLLFGQEKIPSNFALAVMNRILSRCEMHSIIRDGDAITKPVFTINKRAHQQFEITVSNPPANVNKWGYEYALDDSFNRFFYGIPPKTKGNYAHILHMLSSLNDTGRMAVVVPHGVLFRGAVEGDIRKALVDANQLDTVIGLPEKLFYRGNMPSAIMIFKKVKVDSNVLFIDASKMFQANRSRNLLRKNDISSIVELYFNRKTVRHVSYLATSAEVKDQDYNLNISRYIDVEDFEVVKISHLLAEHDRQSSEALTLGSEINSIFQKLTEKKE